MIDKRRLVDYAEVNLFRSCSV
ncbi:MAG: hypothetical protein RIT28_3227, partial [Pseudomonadota bacterium]